MAKRKELVEQLEIEADTYLEECLANTTEKLANTGRILNVSDRHIPTIDYFINIHLLLINKKKLIRRTTFYAWINCVDIVPEDIKDEDLTPHQRLQRLKTNTIKRIDLKFKALATDIVANEGKGIFYAKNRLGMTDKLKTDETKKITHTILSLGSGVKPPEEEVTQLPEPEKLLPTVKKVFVLQKKK